jgi:hypothetical protein
MATEEMMNANQARLEMCKLFGERAAVAIARDDNDPSISHYMVGCARPVKGPPNGWKKKKKLPEWARKAGVSKYEQTYRADFMIDVYGWGESWQEAVGDALLEIMSGMGRASFYAHRSKAYSRPVLKVDLSKLAFCHPHNVKNFAKHTERYASKETAEV